MDGEQFYGAAYRGSKQFSQQDVRTANATGFGAAADDYAERGIDLNEQLIRNKPATFFFRMKGDAMTGAGIFDGDVLIVDRSLKLADGKVIVAILNGELLIRRYHKNFSSAFLIAENERLNPSTLPSSMILHCGGWWCIQFINYEMNCQRLHPLDKKMKYELFKNLGPFGLVNKKQATPSLKGDKINIISPYKKECTAKKGFILISLMDIQIISIFSFH